MNNDMISTSNITGEKGSPLASFEGAIELGKDEKGEIDAGLDGDDEGRREAEESQEVTEGVGVFVFCQEEADWLFHGEGEGERRVACERG